MVTVVDLTAIADVGVTDSIIVLVYDPAATGDKHFQATLGQLLQDVARLTADADFDTLESNDFTTSTGQVTTLTIGTSLKYNAGATVSKILRGTSNLTPSDILAGASQTMTFTVTNAATGDHVNLSFGGALPDGLTAEGWVSAANTVSVKFTNHTAGTIASATYSALAAIFRMS